MRSRKLEGKAGSSARLHCRAWQTEAVNAIGRRQLTATRHYGPPITAHQLDDLTIIQSSQRTVGASESKRKICYLPARPRRFELARVKEPGIEPTFVTTPIESPMHLIRTAVVLQEHRGRPMADLAIIEDIGYAELSSEQRKKMPQHLQDLRMLLCLLRKDSHAPSM
jgi:hypothetical protein